jgi:predicted phosphohydrolase
MPKIPDGDVLIVAGDISSDGSKQGTQVFNTFLGRQPHKFKLVIAGNHDWFLYKHDGYEILYNAIYLQDEEVVIEGVKFYGSPYQPEFLNWAFNLRRGLPLERKWKEIPADTDVLITHGPPHGILDLAPDDKEHVGCEDLLKRVYEVKPKVHVFGHIHDCHGREDRDEIIFVNASTCTEKYEPINPAIVVDI